MGLEVTIGNKMGLKINEGVKVGLVITLVESVGELNLGEDKAKMILGLVGKE